MLRPTTLASLLLLMGLSLSAMGCGAQATAGGPAASEHAPGVDAPGLDAPGLDAPGLDARVAGVTYDDHGDPAGLHRYIRWSDRLGQGAQPAGEVAFANLKALGYRTILSVDGSLPEVKVAAKHGLRYVHVPIGYDGIPKDAATRIVKTARITEFPVYVHCHHGKHRGPAAAMLLRLSEDKVSKAEAIEGLKRSGTNPSYTGLWKTVREFVLPTAAELAAVKSLPSRVVPQGLQAGMVDCSHRWTFLKLSKKSGWKTPEDHPDIAPAHEARMLWELFREMARTDKECQDQGEVFLKYLKASEDAAIKLEKAVRAGNTKAADKHFLSVKGLCKDCHRDYRN